MGEEYEVDLIDYLRVMWKWKWLIIGILAVSIAVTAGISVVQPNRYSGVVAYRIASLGSPLGVSIDGSTLAAAVDSLDTTALSDKVTLSSRRTGDQVVVTLTGTLAPSALRDALDRITPLIKKGLSDTVHQKMEDTLALVTRQQAQLTREKDLLTQQMTATTSPDLSAALAGQISNLALQLARVQVQLEGLRTTSPSDLFTLTVVDPPHVTRIGPHRGLNVAIGGVLGGFIGILLAFFLNYLDSYRKRAE